jgi:hypothetical protein
VGGFLLWLGALQIYNDAFYFSLVTFATLGYGIVLARTTASLARWGHLRFADARLVHPLILAAISRGLDRPADPESAAGTADVADRG